MFLRNAWYVAGYDHEFTATPIRRQILGEWLVLYRTNSLHMRDMHSLSFGAAHTIARCLRFVGVGN